jgi:protein involved in polysaccharide export with SLBB domain
MLRFIFASLFTAAVPLLLVGCGLIQKISVPKLPKLGLPNMNTIAKIIPGLPERDTEGSEDPEVPFTTQQTLGYGHTLRLEVYEGARDPERIYRGIVMVNSEGLLSLGQTGTARVGGQKLPQAVNSIASVFRMAGRNTRPITLQLVSVENTPVIAIEGDVRDTVFIPAYQELTVRQAVERAGGRKPGSTKRGIYISRGGQRRFFASLESADYQWRPLAGDIITLSPDI